MRKLNYYEEILQSSAKYKASPQFVGEEPKEGPHSNEGPTVFDHVKKVQDRMSQLPNTDRADKFIAKYHDIGKPDVRDSQINIDKNKANIEKGKPLHSYIGHDKPNSETEEKLNRVMDRIKLSQKEKDASMFAIKNHMFDRDLLEKDPKYIEKLLKDVPPENREYFISKLTNIQRADKTEKDLNNSSDKVLDLFKQNQNKNATISNANEKINNVLGGQKLSQYLMSKGVKGPAIGKIQNIIMSGIDNINSSSDIDNIINKNLFEGVSMLANKKDLLNY